MMTLTRKNSWLQCFSGVDFRQNFAD